LEHCPSPGHPHLVLQASLFFIEIVTRLIVSYIFIAQRELTVSVAFTAISLFSMVRMPLNVIPTFVSPPLPPLERY
jgi:hypothetical protein